MPIKSNIVLNSSFRIYDYNDGASAPYEPSVLSHPFIKGFTVILNEDAGGFNELKQARKLCGPRNGGPSLPTEASHVHYNSPSFFMALCASALFFN